MRPHAVRYHTHLPDRAVIGGHHDIKDRVWITCYFFTDTILDAVPTRSPHLRMNSLALPEKITPIRTATRNLRLALAADADLLAAIAATTRSLPHPSTSFLPLSDIAALRAWEASKAFSIDLQSSHGSDIHAAAEMNRDAPAIQFPANGAPEFLCNINHNCRQPQHREAPTAFLQRR